MRERFYLIPLVLLVAIFTGCGQKSSEGPAEVKVTPEQVEDAASLTMVRAHQVASLTLYKAGDRKKASKHAGHPIEEIFWSISRSLQSKDAALTADLRKSLKEPSKLIFADAPASELDQSFKESWTMLDRAQESLVPTDVRQDASFKWQLISNLLESVEGEYGEAIEGTHIVKQVEYQDAWGALQEANRLFKQGSNSSVSEMKVVKRELGSLMEELPSVNPPAKPATLEQVEGHVEAATAVLAELAGPTSDPVAEIDKVEKLLNQVKQAYANGNRVEAKQLAAEAYLDHFEKIEPELAKRDKQLMEELEVMIATDLRNKIKKGASTGEIDAIVSEATKGLNQARPLLEGKS